MIKYGGVSYKVTSIAIGVCYFFEKREMEASLKRLFLFLLVVILLQNNRIVYAGETQEYPPLTGKAGQNITWTFNPVTGALSLTGTGDMDNWEDWQHTPWYAYCTSIKSLSISEGITSIGHSAFWGCENLTQVTIPSSVVSVGDDAFAECDSLTQVNLQEGVLWIGERSFVHCNSLRTITLPASLTSLGLKAFSESFSLREINVAAGNRKFSSINGVLYNKSGTELLRCPPGIRGEFEIPDGVTTIGPYAFADCIKMSNIRFSDQLSEIQSLAFYHCIDLSSAEFPESLSVIESEAFEYCTGLGYVVFPSNLTSIGAFAFDRCRLTSVALPPNLTSIGMSAFYNCAPLDVFTVYGLPGTYAETYAAANGYSFAVSDHAHKYGRWIVKAVATCTGWGVEECICSICGGVKTKTIPAKGHTPVSDLAVAATCTSEGKTAESHCSICGTVLTTQKTIPAKGHTPVSDPAVAATCTREGKTAGSRCSVCGAVLTMQKTIPAKGHTLVSDPAVAATCTSGGKTAGSRCSVCGAVLTPQKIVAALGHKWGRFTVSKAATALELGEETRICSRCGKKETKEIIKLGAGGKLSPSSIVIYTGRSIKQLAVSGITSGDAVLQWTSSNQKVASVTPSGTVTGRKAGTAYITVTLKSGLTASAKVKVLEEKTQNDSSKPETEISRGSSTSTRIAVRIKAKKIKGLKKKLVIKKGKKVRLKPKLIPKNSTDKIKYKSSNKKIATVSKKGVIKAKKAGKVNITVTAGRVKFVIRVTVKR